MQCYSDSDLAEPGVSGNSETDPAIGGQMDGTGNTLDDGAFRAIIENSSDVIAQFDLSLRCSYVNASISRYMSLPREHFLGKTLADGAWPEAWAKPVQQGLDAVLRSREAQRVELAPGACGEQMVFEIRLFPELDANRALASILCIAREITEASLARRLLTEENAVLEMIADNRPVKVIMHNVCQMIESQLAGGMCAIMTIDPGGETLSLAAAPSLPGPFRHQLEALSIGPDGSACGSAAYWKRSVIVNDIGESPLWESLRPAAEEHGLHACWSTPIFTSDHQLLGTLAIYYTENRSPTPRELRLIYRSSHIAAIALQRNLHESQLYRLATQDGLTRLFNRRHFIECAEQHLSQARRYQHPVSVLMLDLDHFKQINDRYGHATGDRVLELFSRICQRCLRSADIIGRMGGEEFAALLPDTGLGEARKVAERVRRTVNEAALTDGDKQIRFQVSIGIANLRTHETLDALLVRADKMLYQAKSQGRNRVCAEPPPGSPNSGTQGELPLEIGSLADAVGEIGDRDGF
jgi:diguanylate cyclase (GGDEF)-like protein/PAS domain S-box-containing protein